MKRVTIKDIAKAAGVSTATVSHVLNDSAPISEGTKSKVMKVVKQSRYEPNASARNLRKRSTKTIGFVANTIMSDLIPDMIGGAMQCAVDRGYSLVVGEARQQVDNQDFHTWLSKSNQVSGLLFCSNWVTEVDYEIPPDMPVMYLYCYSRLRPLDYVLPDSVRGGYTATKHLIEIGRKNIAYVGGTKDWKCTNDRLEGYRLALNEAGIGYRGSLITYGDWAAEGGFQAGKALLKSNKLIDGIFAANDAMAVGVIDALQDAGLRVPGDISVVGYDDIPAAKLTRPALTTVKLPNYDMGYAACSSLIDKMEKENSSTSWHTFECKLVVRDSCGYNMLRTSNG